MVNDLPTHEVAKSAAWSIILATLGVLATLMGLFIILPVVIDLPDSWFGAVLAIALLAIGVALLYGAFQNWKSRHQVQTAGAKDAF